MSGRRYCVRQRAGPLVKECRALRPRLSRDDSPYERAEKNKILRPPRDSRSAAGRWTGWSCILPCLGMTAGATT